MISTRQPRDVLLIFYINKTENVQFLIVVLVKCLHATLEIWIATKKITCAGLFYMDHLSGD